MKIKQITALLAAAFLCSVSGCSTSSGSAPGDSSVPNESSAPDESAEAAGSAAAALLAGKSVGDVIEFGDYRWFIIAMTSDRCKLLCTDAVAKMPYHNEDTDVTWETCTLRTWLNGEFYDTFTDEEKAMIALTQNSNPSESADIPGGNDTEDYIYLPSEAQMKAIYDEMNTEIPVICEAYWSRATPRTMEFTAAPDKWGDTLYARDRGAAINRGVRPMLDLVIGGTVPDTAPAAAYDPSAAALVSGRSVGDVVEFGDYMWYIIDMTDDRCTLLCEYVLGDRAFSSRSGSESTAYPWEDSDSRVYLNCSFYYGSFSEAERAMIAPTTNANPANSKYGTAGCADTQDYIYLLSIDEAEALPEELLAAGTEAYPSQPRSWWLRSPGEDPNDTAMVSIYQWNQETYIQENVPSYIDTAGEWASLIWGLRPALTLYL